MYENIYELIKNVTKNIGSLLDEQEEYIKKIKLLIEDDNIGFTIKDKNSKKGEKDGT